MLRPITILLFICGVLFLSGCKEEEQQPTELNLTLVTYNVAGLPEGLSSSHPATYTSAISPLLNEFNIIHVQEDFCYHDSLLLHNTHPYRTEHAGCVPNGDGLNTLSDFPISDVARTAWENCTGADCLTPKGFYYSRIKLTDQMTVDFYNVHCNAGASDASFRARRGNIAQVCSHIQQHSSGNAVIIMGDFNSRYTRDGDTIRAFFELGFKDAWVELIRGGSVPELSPDRLDACDPNRTNADCERVDKVFYRSNSTIEITPLSYRVDDERFYYQGVDSLQLSDHWPVFTEFRFKLK